MPRFVALLRGVNVGRGRRVAMADLRSLLEGLGCTSVRTFRNSGNAVFDDAGYLACPAGISRSDLAAAVLGRAGRRVTTRNWATVRELDALVREARGGS